jgi:hypothetical protein
VIVVAVAATTIVVTLVGIALRPGDAGAPRLAPRPSWQKPVESSDKLQFHMLGYARRAAPMKELASAQEGGSSTYVKQGGDAVPRTAGEHAATNSDDPSADVVTGSTNIASEPAASATDDATSLAAPASLASARSGASNKIATGPSPVIALSAVPLPPERPKHLRPPLVHAIRAAAGVNNAHNIFAPQDRTATP